MTDAHWMGRALALARGVLGRTAPNPAVGAVLVREGQVLGEGATCPPGGDHAEVVALRSAREAGHDPRGATLYVTLEPCCHHGRTPPCTEAILHAGVARVVVGTLDPFPAMQGRGLARLREGGVEVVLGVEREPCERQILGFARSVTEGLPEVTAKAAVSADGHLATITGESQWITGPEAREVGHRLRASHDAMLVGIGTVLADDPRLTCRLPDDPSPHQPVPVVLDSGLSIPEGARIFQHPRRPVILCEERAPERALPADILRVPADDEGRVDVEAALRALARRGLHRVMVEGGGAVHRSLLSRGLVDTLHLFVAGLLIPGGRSWVGGPPIDRLQDAIRMELDEVRRVGADAELIFRLRHEVAHDPLAGLREGA